MTKRFYRTLRAQLRDFRVLLGESKFALLVFLVVVLGGGMLFFLSYRFPDTNQGPGFGESIYASFALVFFETILPFPEQWYLQLIYFLIPIIGLTAVVDGLLRFGSALTSKQTRGQKWQVAMASTYRNHIIVCGVGKVGYRVILELSNYERELVAIEQSPDGRFVDKVKELGVPVIIADARRTETLYKAGIEHADAIVPVTDDELTNVDIGLDALEIRPDIKVVLRMFDPDLARRVETGFGIKTAFSTSALAAPIFASAAMRMNAKHSFYIGDTLLNISELLVGPESSLIGKTAGQLEAEMDLSVVCYEDQNCVDYHPGEGKEIQPGNKLLFLVPLGTSERLQQMNRGEA